MPSQVHQVFYVPDPIQDSLHYVVNKVPRDLLDFEEESSENVADSYWCETNENRSEYVAQTNEHDGELLRNDMPPDDKSDESDYDDTLWDWMSGDEDHGDHI